MGGRNIADASREDDEDEDMPTRSRHPPPRLDWKKLGQKASVAFRRTPNVDFMYVYPRVIWVDPNQPNACISLPCDVSLVCHEHSCIHNVSRNHRWTTLRETRLVLATWANHHKKCTHPKGLGLEWGSAACNFYLYCSPKINMLNIEKNGEKVWWTNEYGFKTGGSEGLACKMLASQFSCRCTVFCVLIQQILN